MIHGTPCIIGLTVRTLKASFQVNNNSSNKNEYLFTVCLSVLVHCSLRTYKSRRNIVSVSALLLLFPWSRFSPCHEPHHHRLPCVTSLSVWHSPWSPTHPLLQCLPKCRPLGLEPGPAVRFTCVLSDGCFLSWAVSPVSNPIPLQIGAEDEDQALPLSTLQVWPGVGSQVSISPSPDKGDFCGIVLMLQGNLFRLHPQFAYQNHLLFFIQLLCFRKVANFCFLCLPPLWNVLADYWAALIANAVCHFLFSNSVLRWQEFTLQLTELNSSKSH